MTFEVDANGILQVKAEDKVAKTSQTITISNDKGRLTQEEIDEMIREAEEFAEEDRVVKEKIDAKNKLETYVYNMKSTMADKEKLAEKLSEEDKEKIEEVLKETLEWLEENVNAEKDDYEEKLKDVESVCNPVIKSVYKKTGGESEEDGEDGHDEL